LLHAKRQLSWIERDASANADRAFDLAAGHNLSIAIEPVHVNVQLQPVSLVSRGRAAAFVSQAFQRFSFLAALFTSC